MTPWTVARQAPLSVEFSRPEYWSGLPCPSPGDLPNPGIYPGLSCLLCWQMGSLLLVEKAMAPHSNALAWKIPWTEEAVSGVARSQTRLSDFTFTFHFHALEKEMATHSKVLAWRIPGTGEPSGLPSMRLHKVGDD